MTNAPDFQGYREAQQRHREQTGRTLPFFTPEAAEWPPDTPLGLNGEPLDPTVKPISGGDLVKSCIPNCTVAQRPARGAMQPQADHSEIGTEPLSHILVIVGLAEYEEGAVEETTQLETFGVRYKIESAVPDQIGPGEVQRMLVFAERM